MKKKIKKAFTLVELLVVIAILAILATVSIVGYNSFTKKAKVSNDTALVSQLNTVLKADSILNGDAETPSDALVITEEAGYDVEKLTPTATGYQIIWNQEVNQFALLDENDNVVYGEKNTDEYKNWKFVSTCEASSTYSMYLKGNSISDELTVSTGIDVGNNTGITTINYSKNNTIKDDVRIRTNGGTLNINADTDTVRHFATIDKVVIDAVANNSYHEYGSVLGDITIKSGHVAIEKVADVATIVAQPTDSVKVTVENENSVGTIVTTDTTKTTLNVPEIIKQNENISSEKINEMSYFAAGLGTKNSPYLLSTAEQFKNIKKLNDEMFKANEYYFKLVDDIDLTDYVGCTSWRGDYFCGEIDGNGFSLTLGLTHSGEQLIFSESIGNVTIKNLKLLQNKYLGVLFFINNSYGYNAPYKNTIKGNVIYKDIIIENLPDVDQTIIAGNNDGTLVSQVAGNVTFENITINANFNNGAYYSGLIVGGFINDVLSKNCISFINCTNNGSFEGKDVGFLIGNSCNTKNIKICNDKEFTNVSDGSYIFVENCRNYGVLKGTSTAGITAENGDDNFAKSLNESLSNNYVLNNGYIYVSNVNIELVNENNKIRVSDDVNNAEKYVLIIQASTKTLTGSYYVRIEDDTISPTKSINKIDKMIGYKEYKAKYSKTINNFGFVDLLGFKYTIISENNQTIAVFDNSDGSFTLNEVSPTYIIAAYNNEGKLLGTKNYKF